MQKEVSRNIILALVNNGQLTGLHVSGRWAPTWTISVVEWNQQTSEDLETDSPCLFLRLSEVSPTEHAPVLRRVSVPTSALIVFSHLLKESTSATHSEPYLGTTP